MKRKTEIISILSLLLLLATLVGCGMQNNPPDVTIDESTKDIVSDETKEIISDVPSTEKEDKETQTEATTEKESVNYKHYTDGIEINTYDSCAHLFEEEARDTSVVLSYKIADIQNIAVYPLYVYHKTGNGVDFDYSFSQTEISVISKSMNQCIDSTTKQSLIYGESGTLSVNAQKTWNEQFMCGVGYQHNNNSTLENAQDNKITIDSVISNQKETIKEYTFAVSSGSFDGLPEAYYRISLKATAEVYEIVSLHYATNTVDVSYKIVFRNFYFDCDYSENNCFDIPVEVYKDAGITSKAISELYESKIGCVENQLYNLVKSNVYLDLGDSIGNMASCSASSIEVSYQGTYDNLPEPTRVGWQFTGWKTEDGRDVKKTSKVTEFSDHTLKATWELVRSMEKGDGSSFDMSNGEIQYKFFSVTERLDLNYLIGQNKSLSITVSFDVEEKNDGYQNFGIADAQGYQDKSDKFWGHVSFNNLLYYEKINKGLGKQSYTYNKTIFVKAEQITTGEIWLAYKASGTGKNDFTVSNLRISVQVIG